MLLLWRERPAQRIRRRKPAGRQSVEFYRPVQNRLSPGPAQNCEVHLRKLGRCWLRLSAETLACWMPRITPAPFIFLVAVAFLTPPFPECLGFFEALGAPLVD